MSAAQKDKILSFFITLFPSAVDIAVLVQQATVSHHQCRRHAAKIGRQLTGSSLRQQATAKHKSAPGAGLK